MGNKIVVNDGKVWFGGICMDGSNPDLDGNVKLHLFSNNYTIIETTTLADLTEISFTGYAAVVLTGATDGGIDVNDRDTWTWPTATFQATSSAGLPKTAYGYYVTDYAVTTLLWAQNFSSPFTFSGSGDGFTIPPQMSFGSIF